MVYTKEEIKLEVREMTKKDFLEEIVEERTKKNPEFAEMVEAALERRQLLRELAKRRARQGLTQEIVAERMRTSQSAVARMEAGEVDARLSTVERYAAAVGQRVEWHLADA